MYKRILVTGGAGFIGSAFVRKLLEDPKYVILVLDSLTYAATFDSLQALQHHPRFSFICQDIRDSEKVENLFRAFRPEAVVHLAAETHVDRSILSPQVFIETNIVGTYNLLHVAYHYWNRLKKEEKENFRFHHVSTDEVFGSLEKKGYFSETSPYAPRSPYAASKANSDHLVSAWHHTYGLPILLTYCSNNYGPFQFPEKLIPLMILNALAEKILPLYGTGQQIRDWIYVGDHVRALKCVLEKGEVGERYLIGAEQEMSNRQLVETICKILDELAPRKRGDSYMTLIRSVPDRLGHDFRYAVNPHKIKEELHWQTEMPFTQGLKETILWYVHHPSWCQDMLNRRQQEARRSLSLSRESAKEREAQLVLSS